MGRNLIRAEPATAALDPGLKVRGLPPLDAFSAKVPNWHPGHADVAHETAADRACDPALNLPMSG